MSDNLFDNIKCLYTKKPLSDNLPSSFILHRFLASDPKLAIIASELNVFVRDSDRCWKIWHNAIPKQKKAPFLAYAAPKKQVTDEFVCTYAKTYSISYENAKYELYLYSKMNKLDEVKQNMGVT